MHFANIVVQVQVFISALYTHKCFFLFIFFLFTDLPRATITADPDRSVFIGETISLKCSIESHYSDWRFQWSKYSSTFDAGEPEKITSRETLTIEKVSMSDQDKYHCWGDRDNRPMKSQQSVAFSIKVEGECFIVCNTHSPFKQWNDIVTMFVKPIGRWEECIRKQIENNQRTHPVINSE